MCWNVFKLPPIVISVLPKNVIYPNFMNEKIKIKIPSISMLLALLLLSIFLEVNFRKSSPIIKKKKIELIRKKNIKVPESGMYVELNINS